MVLGDQFISIHLHTNEKRARAILKELVIYISKKTSLPLRSATHKARIHPGKQMGKQGRFVMGKVPSLLWMEASPKPACEIHLQQSHEQKSRRKCFT